MYFCFLFGKITQAETCVAFNCSTSVAESPQLIIDVSITTTATGLSKNKQKGSQKSILEVERLAHIGAVFCHPWPEDMRDAALLSNNRFVQKRRDIVKYCGMLCVPSVTCHKTFKTGKKKHFKAQHASNEMHVRILTLTVSLKLRRARVKPHKVPLISREYAELHIWLIWKEWGLNVMRLRGYVQLPFVACII